MVTGEQLKKIVPLIGVKLKVFLVPLNDAMDEFNINTPLRQAAFIAQIAHESGSFRYVSEIASGKAYDNRKDLGNTDPEAIRVAKLNNSTPGRWWKGHGLIQITGYYNHLKCGKALGLDLVNNPLLLTLPVDACRSAAWFWETNGLNALAEMEDFRLITKKINGGYNGLEDRLQFYERAKKVLGV